MASPAPNSPSHAKEHYYYFVVAVAVIAVLLIASNMLVVGCCSRCRLARRFLQLLGILSSSPEGDHISHAIPSCKYRKEKAAAESECSVCLMAFVEGEEVRQMPKCKHLFHAPCIDMWLYSHSNCPMCRADVLPKALQSHHTTTAAAAAAGAAREDAGYSWRSLIESGSMTGVVVSML